jgi:hypothetical protein
MCINWQEIAITAVTTVGGGGAVLAAAAWLIKALVSNRLALDVEKFKIQMKGDVDKEIVRMRGDVDKEIVRLTHVHERQLDILQKLYCHLSAAQDLFMRMTSAGRIQNELTPEEYVPHLAEAMKSARDELVRGRLFIPQSLAQQCDSFLALLFEGRADFDLAFDPRADPNQRAELWKSAATLAHTKVPKLLQEIEAAARKAVT